MAISIAKTSTARRWVKRIGWTILVAICVILGGSAVSNFFFRCRSDVVDRLSDLDKARVLEAFQLRHQCGDSIWKGWSDANISILMYNEEYAFLIGISNPSSGWRTVPEDVHRGGPWEIVHGDSIGGKEYYRQRLPSEGASPQAFTVRVGEQWAASMTTKEWTTIKMGNEIRDGLPSVIRPFIPYRLIARILLGLTMNTDAYICAIEHESFHAFQGMAAMNRLMSAEGALSRYEKNYPWNDQSFNGAWKEELNALADALGAKDDKVAIELIREFLSLRRTRRLSAHLDSSLVNLEQVREWEEGLAKYTELALWKCAAEDSSYNPVKELSTDKDFNRYKTFGRQWAQELSTLRFQSQGDEIRFYYAGMAQGFLLERFLPDWKARILKENVFLENLLNEVITLHGI